MTLPLSILALFALAMFIAFIIDICSDKAHTVATPVGYSVISACGTIKSVVKVCETEESAVEYARQLAKSKTFTDYVYVASIDSKHKHKIVWSSRNGLY